jgi:outer membrane immunogenic protein
MRTFALVICAMSGLIGSSALAADMAAKAPSAVAPVQAAPSWTGFYIGGNVGAGWGHQNATFAANDPSAANFLGAVSPPPMSFKTDDVLGGVQLGYNWQVQPAWVVGFETDFDWTSLKGSSTANTALQTATYSEDEHIKWFGTVRARLGWLASPNLLIYGTGGLAYARVEHSGNVMAAPGFSIFNTTGGFSYFCGAPGPTTCFAGSSNAVDTGWTAGGGLEWAIAPHWSVKGEYLFVSLKNNSMTETALGTLAPVTPASFTVNSGRTDFNVLRAGLNYRF